MEPCTSSSALSNACGATTKSSMSLYLCRHVTESSSWPFASDFVILLSANMPLLCCTLRNPYLQKTKDAWISFIKGCEVLNVNEVRTSRR